MKPMPFILLTIFLIPRITSAAGELRAFRTHEKLLLDGKLEEAAWQQAAAYSDFLANRGGHKAEVKTEVRFLYDDRTVYIGIKAFMPPGSKYYFFEKNLYAGECVEVMLDPGATRNVYFHFITNPKAEKYDAFRDQGGFVGDPKWDAVWDVAVHKTPEFWSCEFSIPLSSLDIPAGAGAQWTVNVARGARGLPPGGAMEDSAIALDGAYHIAGKFLPLTGFDVDFREFSGWRSSKPEISTTAASEPGSMGVKCKVNFVNLYQDAREAAAFVDLYAPGNVEVMCKSSALELPAGRQEPVIFEGFNFSTAGDFLCDVRLCDPITKRTLHRRQYTIPVHFQPLTIRLLDPHYKNAIFATMKLENVRYQVNVALTAQELEGKKLLTGIRDTNGTILFSEVAAPAAESVFTFPAATLPEERMQIFAALEDPTGNSSDEATAALRKLPYLEGEVYLAKDGTFIRDGKPFFPLMQWAANEDFIEGVNVFLDWKPYRDTLYISPAISFNKEIAKTCRADSINSEDAAKLREIVGAEMRKPGLFAYYLSDEPEVFGDTVNALNQFYQVITDTDPWHPVILSNNSVTGIYDYANAGDVNGAHSYPKPHRTKPFNDFEKIVNFVDAFHGHFKGRAHFQSLAWLAQGFDYSNYAAVNTCIPRYLEMRNQHLMSLIAGGRGIILYNRFNEHYPEIGVGLVEHVKELQAYAPAFLEPDPGAALKIEGEGIRAIVRKHRGHWWIFAAGFRRVGEQMVRLTLPELGNASFRVLTEDRNVAAVNGVIQDKFEDFAVHVYTSDPEYPQLRSGNDIKAEIKRINAARKKPGNLAFQMFEHETVRVTASSNKALNVRPDNCLWHVADGVVQPSDFKHYYSEQVVWTDATPNQSPDWIELTFKEPVAIARVIVYPVNNSLRNYRVQLRSNGEYQDVADIEEAKGTAQEHRFPQQKADAVRIFITATRGANAKISEIEVYEK